MAYLRCPPMPPLDRVVDHLWVFEDHEVGADAGLLFADGCTDLMFHLTGAILLRHGDHVTRWTGGWISGQRTRAISIELLSRRFTMVGARLRPVGLGALLHAPADEAHDLVLELGQFWRGFAAETCERLALADGPAARLHQLQMSLAQRLRARQLPATGLTTAVEMLHRQPAERRIAELRERLGVSHKHLTRLFRAHVGLSPKTFQRVSRFRRLLHAVDAQPARIRWAALAQAHGYSDQAHLCREFRAFTGMAPTSYRAPTVAAPDYMPWAPP
jgi:AraC-like DNA-binding protein